MVQSWLKSVGIVQSCLKSVGMVQFWLKSDNYNGHFT
jgi:hypothetical protein